MDFIVLDELGYLPFAQSGGQLLFHLDQPALRAHLDHRHHQPRLRRMAERLRRRQDDHRAARSPHPPLRHRRDRQRQLALQEPRLTSNLLKAPSRRCDCATPTGYAQRLQARRLKGVKIGRRSGVKFGRRLTQAVQFRCLSRRLRFGGRVIWRSGCNFRGRTPEVRRAPVYLPKLGRCCRGHCLSLKFPPCDTSRADPV